MPGSRPDIIARMDGYEIDIDKSRLQLSVIHEFLAQSYWSPGVPLDTVERAIAGADCFGVYLAGEQIGFARVITDRATFAWISDVFVLPHHRARGIGKWLMEVIINSAPYQELRSWGLSTRDAHGLYRRFGFEDADSAIIMIMRPGNRRR